MMEKKKIKYGMNHFPFGNIPLIHSFENTWELNWVNKFKTQFVSCAFLHVSTSSITNIWNVASGYLKLIFLDNCLKFD